MGLLSEARYAKVIQMKSDLNQLIEELKVKRFTKKDGIHPFLIEKEYPVFNEGITAYEILKRPRITLNELKPSLSIEHYSVDVLNMAEIEVKYEGYIQKAIREVERLHSLDNVKIPSDINYNDIPHLSIEGKQRMTKIKPLTLGQASRISGVNPADMVVLKTYLNRGKKTDSHTS